MLDIAWPELIVVGVVTLVAVGPEDLPKVMHAMGRFVGKARRAVQALSAQMDQLEYEADVKEHLRARDAAQPGPTSTDQAPADKAPDKPPVSPVPPDHGAA